MCKHILNKYEVNKINIEPIVTVIEHVPALRKLFQIEENFK